MKVENVKIFGLEDSIKASKYPMAVDINDCTEEVTDTTNKLGGCKRGSAHDQFLHGCIVQFDLTFSNKAWVEAERYHWLEFVSSQSTMHRITKFEAKKQCNKYVDPRIIDILQEKINNYNRLKQIDETMPFSKARKEELKELYLEVLYNIPSGFELTARMTTNYCQLKTIYAQRKNHRLPEWREFCKWLETLPHAKEWICCE